MAAPVACILGLDPGLGGAVAFYFPSTPDRVSVYDMPIVAGEVNPAALRARIEQLGPTLAIVERVGPMPRDGVKQAFNFGGSYGIARTVVSLCHVPMSLVTPPVWKKHFRLAGGPEGKEQARALALRMFPASADLFARKMDHNRAEAALIARYGAEVVLSARVAT